MDKTNDIRVALNELCNEVKAILQERIAKYGVNPRTGTNTLQGSELEKSIVVKTIENGLALTIADYWQYVATGWKRSHRFEGTMSQFLANVDDWVKRKGISFPKMTQSQVVWAIVMNIMNNGIKARPFMVFDEEGDLTKMIPELNDVLDEWFEHLFELIIADITKYFNG